MPQACISMHALLCVRLRDGLASGCCGAAMTRAEGRLQLRKQAEEARVDSLASEWRGEQCGCRMRCEQPSKRGCEIVSAVHSCSWQHSTPFPAHSTQLHHSHSVRPFASGADVGSRRRGEQCSNEATNRPASRMVGEPVSAAACCSLSFTHSLLHCLHCHHAPSTRGGIIATRARSDTCSSIAHRRLSSSLLALSFSHSLCSGCPAAWWRRLCCTV